MMNGQLSFYTIFAFVLLSISTFGQCSYRILKTDASSSTSADAMATAVPTHDYQYPIHYTWSTGDTTDVLVNAAPGTYSLTVTDASGCSQVISIDIVVGTKTRAIMIASGRDLLDEAFLLNIDVDSLYCTTIIPKFTLFAYAIGVDTSTSFDFTVDFGDGNSRTISRKGDLSTLSNARYQYNVVFARHKYASRQNYDVTYMMSNGSDSARLLRPDEIVFSSDDCENCNGYVQIFNQQPPDPNGANSGSFNFSLVNVTPYYWVFNPYIGTSYMTSMHSVSPVDTSFGVQTPLFQPSGIPADSVRIYFYDFFTGCFGDTVFYFGTDLALDQYSDVQVNVFPNPASDRVNVTWDNGNDLRFIALYNSVGQVVYRTNHFTHANGTKILRDLGWSSGVYTLNIGLGNGMELRRKIIFR